MSYTETYMDLSIITVTYQSANYIDACILSVVTHTLACDYEHLIVDNGSTDGTVELIENGYLGYVHLIKSDQNIGFAAANQLALKKAKGRYLLFLNPDMQIHEGFLDTLITWMETHTDAGIAGCKLLDSSFNCHEALRPSKFPSLLPYLPAFLKCRPFFCTVHPRFFYTRFRDDLQQEVDVVRGSFLLMKREVLEKLGFAFNPRYFILFEDIDTCHAVKHLGYKILYTPMISCIDHFGRSFLSQTKAWKYLQMARSLKTYVRRWHSPWHLCWLNCVIPIGFLLRVPEWGIQDAWNALKSKD